MRIFGRWIGKPDRLRGLGCLDFLLLHIPFLPFLPVKGSKRVL